LLELAWAELPKAMQARTILIKEDLEHLPAAELQARVEGELQRWEREYERLGLTGCSTVPNKRAPC
jgi:hypothetical protein